MKIKLALVCFILFIASVAVAQPQMPTYVLGMGGKAPMIRKAENVSTASLAAFSNSFMGFHIDVYLNQTGNYDLWITRDVVAGKHIVNSWFASKFYFTSDWTVQYNKQSKSYAGTPFTYNAGSLTGFGSETSVGAKQYPWAAKGDIVCENPIVVCMDFGREYFVTPTCYNQNNLSGVVAYAQRVVKYLQSDRRKSL